MPWSITYILIKIIIQCEIIIKIQFIDTNTSSYSNGTTELHTLVSAQQTRTMQSTRGMSSPFLVDKSVIDIVLCKIGYFCLMHPITHSTWICTFAILLVSSTSMADSWLFPFVKAAIYSLTWTVPMYSAMSNLRSARTTSLGKSFWSIPLFSVKCLSLTHPPQQSDTKHTTPWGVMPRRTFAILWCL